MATPAPHLLWTEYDGGTQVTAQWQRLEETNQFELVVYQGNEVLASASIMGVLGSVQLKQPITSLTAQVAVKAVVKGTAGPESNRLLVAVEKPSEPKASYDGSALQASWSLPAKQPANGAQVTVLPPHGPRVAQGTFAGTHGTLALPSSLAEGAQMQVRATIGASIGPPVTIPLVTTRAGTRSLVYTGPRPNEKPEIEVLTSESPPSGCSATLTLYADGQVFASGSAAQGRRVTIPLAAALDPAVTWTARPSWVRGGASGPPGPPVDVLVAPPVLRAVEVDGTASLDWGSIPGPPYPTAAQVRMKTPGKSTVAAVIPAADGSSFTPEPTLAEGLYKVSVAWLRGPAESPESNVLLLPGFKTAVGSTAYDGTTLTVGWEGADPAETSGCLVELLEGETVVEARPATEGRSAWEVELDPAATYQVRLRWLTPHGTGPAGPASPVLAASAGVSALELSESEAVATIAPPAAAPGVTQYVVHLFQGDRLLASSPPVAATADPPIKATIPCSPPAGEDLSVRVQAQKQASFTGPLGPPAPVVASGPAIERAAVNGRKLDLRWRLPAAPPGAIQLTTIQLVAEPGSGAQYELPGTSATVDLPAGFPQPNASYTLQGTVKYALGDSLPGPSQDLLSSAPVLTAASWDGERVNASWAWGADGGANEATAYRLELLEDGVRRGEAVVEGPAGTLRPDSQLDPTASIQLAVSPLAPGTELAGTRVAAPPWSAPGLWKAEVTQDRSHVKLSWAPAEGALTGYEAVFSTPGEPDAFAELPATSPAVVPLPCPRPLPSDPFRETWVAVRAVGLHTTGPTSEPLPILSSPPRIEEIALNDGRLDVRGAPALGEMDGYQLKPSWDDATFSSPTPSATIPAPPIGTAECFLALVARRRGAASPSEGGAQGLQLVTGSPTIDARSYDGAALTVQVRPPAQALPELTGYRIALADDGAVVREAELPVPAPGQPLTLPFERPGGPSAAYEVRVRARADRCFGPTAAAPVVLDAPAVTRVEAGEQIEATVDAGDLPRQELMLEARLIVDGTPGPPQTADGQGRVAFPSPSPGSACAVSARATYPDATGPWSQPTPLPFSAPVLTSARYEDGQLLAAWEGEPDGTYLTTVLAGGIEVAQTMVQGGEAVLRLAPPGAEAEVAVRQLAGVALGPVARLKLVTTGVPASALTAADQASATVSWTPPQGGPPPTAFVPVLVVEGVARDLTPVAGDATTASVPLTDLPSGAAVGVRVQAGAAVGPVGRLAPVVLGKPADFAISWSEEELTAKWSPPQDPRVDGALVTLSIPGEPEIVSRVNGTEWATPIRGDVEGVTVKVAATAGRGTGAATSPATMIGKAPTIVSAVWDGSALTVAWEEAAQADRYRVAVWDRGEIVAERTVAAASVTLPLSQLSPENGVTVASLDTNSTGPASAPVSLPSPGPAVSQIEIDSATGKATVGWEKHDPPLAYLVQAYLDGEPDGPPVEVAEGTSVTLAQEPEQGQALSVAVRSRQQGEGQPLSQGPFGRPTPVVTTPPAIRDVSFDGKSMRVKWDPVAGATGYAISILAGDDVLTSESAPAGATSYLLALPLQRLDLDYTVVVQSRHESSTGLRATAPLFQPGLLVQASEARPRLVPATKLDVTAPLEPITAYLPPLGIPPDKLPIPKPDEESDPPFTIAANEDPTTQEALPLKLTIAAGALEFGTDRPQLAGRYSLQLGRVEAAGATPQGVFTVQQAISRLMPQTFAETLYYAYGLSATRRCVDLRPGTILRVAASEFDLTAVDPGPPWSSGYAPGSVVDLPVGDYFKGEAGDGWQVGFDAFIAWATGNDVLRIPQPDSEPNSGTPVDFIEAGGSDAADLFYPLFVNPYYRLLLPAELQKASAPALSRTGRQFAIASAPTWSEIDATTPGANVAVAYFRGRAVLKLCVRVEVNGAEQVVPVGTTVGNVLDEIGRRPPAAEIPLEGLRLERALGPAVLDPGAPYDAGACNRVYLGWDRLVTWEGGRSALSLPLLNGDRLTVEEGL